MKPLLALCLMLYAAPAYAPDSSPCKDLTGIVVRHEGNLWLYFTPSGQPAIFESVTYSTRQQHCGDTLFIRS